MSTSLTQEITLIGLALHGKTTNENGQSGVDIGQLWQRFETERIYDLIPDKRSTVLYAVYYNYEGGHLDPFSYFIGAQVDESASIPEGLSRLIIPKGQYQKFTASGLMPKCIEETWEKIWQSNIIRAFNIDFEIYDDRSQDWNNAEIDIFVSVKE